MRLGDGDTRGLDRIHLCLECPPGFALVDVGVLGPFQRRVGKSLYQVIPGVGYMQSGPRPQGEVGGDPCG
jgi:hypothetical protein